MEKAKLQELGLTDEQIKAVFAENGKDIEALKTAKEALENDLKTAKESASEIQKKLGDLEKSAENSKEVSEKLAKLKKEISEREESDKKAVIEKQLEDNINTAIADKKFTSDYAKNGIVSEIKTALLKPENAGKGIADIMGEITNGKDGIFANENTVKMGGIGDMTASGNTDTLRAAMGLPTTNTGGKTNG